MIYERGNIWTELGKPGSVIIVTGNNIIKNNGQLVMGAGTALQMKQKFPSSPVLFADLVKESGKDYFYIQIELKNQLLGLLQTKRHYRDNSDYDLIKQSLNALYRKASRNISLIFNCIIPGVGLGRLNEKLIKDMIIEQHKPDNVVFWKNDEVSR